MYMYHDIYPNILPMIAPHSEYIDNVWRFDQIQDQVSV